MKTVADIIARCTLIPEWRHVLYMYFGCLID